MSLSFFKVKLSKQFLLKLLKLRFLLSNSNGKKPADTSQPLRKRAALSTLCVNGHMGGEMVNMKHK